MHKKIFSLTTGFHFLHAQESAGYTKKMLLDRGGTLRYRILYRTCHVSKAHNIIVG